MQVTVTRTVDINKQVFDKIMGGGNGVWLIRVHQKNIVKIARLPKEQPVADLLEGKVDEENLAALDLITEDNGNDPQGVVEVKEQKVMATVKKGTKRKKPKEPPPEEPPEENVDEQTVDTADKK